jgi:hypothetical protein
VRWAGLTALVLLVPGCSGAAESAAERAARAFSTALESGDAAAACALLAPATRSELERSEGAPCPQALPALGLTPLDRISRLERYGRQAAVHGRGAGAQPDTWFLSRFDDRWLVVAAGCRVQGEVSASCDVTGP